MKNVVLFTAAFVFGLLSHESSAQGTISSNTFFKMKIASIQKLHPAGLPSIPSLFNSKNAFAAATNKNKPAASTAQAYLVDTATVYAAYDTTIIRYIYSYNDSGLVVSELSNQWLNGQWANLGSSTVTWEPGNNQFVVSSSMWHNGQWVNFLLATYTLDAFNPNAHLISVLTLIDTLQNGQWENYLRELNTYNTNGKELTQLGQMWFNGQWYAYSSDTSAYDANGNQITNIQENWNNGQVVQFNSDTCTYDASGHKLTDLNVNNYNPSQVSRSLDTYTYDQNGNKISDLYQAWDNGQWVNFMLNTYTYDASGHQIADSSDIWGSQWIFTNYETKTYDGSGHLLTDSSKEWSGSQYILTQLLTNTYDANGNLLSSAKEAWNGLGLAPFDNNVEIPDGPNNGLMTNYYGYKVLLSYELADIFVFTSVPAGKSGIPQTFSLAQNYPNPFNPSTTISFSLPSQSFVSLKVFDIVGREVATIVSEEMPAGAYTRQWNAAKMSSGIYFYRLQAGSYTQTKKLVLLK